MNKESFLEVVRQQYAEEIHAAYLEHEHGGGKKIDVQGLNKCLQKLMANAKVEGLAPAEFEELVHATLPEEVVHHLELALVRKAA